MISDEISFRPRYNEVDKMGYVYHANYVTYCHMARTELLRKIGLEDSKLEEMKLMMPVIDMHLKYIKPAHYDEVLKIQTSVQEIPKIRFKFEFDFFNEQDQKICSAQSTLVFTDSETRKPIKVPPFIVEILSNIHYL